jgi:hypothetical protein
VPARDTIVMETQYLWNVDQHATTRVVSDENRAKRRRDFRRNARPWTT